MQSCCWKCVPCSTNEISHNPVNRSCRRCPVHHWPNQNHTACSLIIPTAIKLSDPAGIAVGVVSMIGIISVIFIGLVFYRHGNTHIVRASSKPLSHMMLFGTLLGYLTAVMAFLERTKTLCISMFFTFSISSCIIVAALFIKTNRLYRLYRIRTTRKGTVYATSNFLPTLTSKKIPTPPPPPPFKFSI